MVNIRYLELTHDSKPGDEKWVADKCARVLVLLGKAEYVRASPDSDSGENNTSPGPGQAAPEPVMTPAGRGRKKRGGG